MRSASVTRSTTWSSPRTWITQLFRDVAEAQVLHLEELVHPVLRAFAADTGFLDPAERRHFGRNDADVDAHDSRLDAFGDAPDASDVAAVEIRRETVLGIVRELEQVLLALEAVQRRHRAESLFASHFHR